MDEHDTRKPLDGEQAEILPALRGRYEELLDSVEAIVWSGDPRTFRFDFVSRRAEQILGYPVERWTAEPSFWLEHIHPDDREWAISFCRAAAAERRSHAFNYRMISAGGSVVWLRNVVRVAVEDGVPAKLFGIMIDVTESKRAQEKARFQETLLNAVGQAVIATDLEGTIVYWNRSAEALYGWSADEAMGRRVADILLSEDLRAQAAEIMAKLRAGGSWSGEFLVRRRDGSSFWALITDTPVHDERGNLVAIVSVSTDITERKQAEEVLRESEERLRRLADSAFEGIIISDRGKILEANKAYAAMHGYELSEIIGRSVLEWVAPEYRALVWQNILSGLEEPYESVEVKKDGTHIEVEVRGRAFSYQGRTVRVTAVRDVTERNAAKRRLEHQAFHDHLTELPNRALFLDRLGHALERTERRKGEVAVLFMDLDNFKVINDSLGHQVGDRLLVAVTERLKTCLRPEDTLARFGGDEFAVAIENVVSPGDVTRVADRIAEELRVPFLLAGRGVVVSACIGISLGAPGRASPDEMVRNADTAMYRAKKRGGVTYEVFDPSMQSHALRRLEIEGDLRRAIERGQFELHYQPKVVVGTGEVVGVEALVRWRHPERGLEFPAEFISVVEETGLIVPLGRWVLEEACRQTREWQERYLSDPPLEINVNLSARQFLVPGLAGEIRDVLRKTGLDPATLVLEITESTLMRDVSSTLAALRWLKDLGVRLAIDDFGTGYSSLSYLKKFPMDAIKIDQSITSGLEQDAGNTAIVATTVTLAHALGLEAVAEGVERAEEVAELQKLGCDQAQGYYFAKPLPREDAVALLRTGSLP